MRHLPSFKALQAFEATMRHGTLSDAARDLNVTPGAVSRQISALEDDLGFKLMTRHHEGITPNHAGEKLARVLGKSFKDISDVNVDIYTVIIIVIIYVITTVIIVFYISIKSRISPTVIFNF